MKTIAVALASERAKAEAIRRRLLEAGFAAVLREETMLQKLWFVSRRSAGVWIEVPAEQFEAAEQRLVGWAAAEGGMPDTIRCPECGSFLVDYPQFTPRSILTNVAMGLAAEAGVVEKDYYCEACHYTWPKEGGKPRHVRRHMAPYYFIEGIEQTGSQPPQSTGAQPDKV
jgi:rubredoxin